jgi:hypothetical protein
MFIFVVKSCVLLFEDRGVCHPFLAVGQNDKFPSRIDVKQPCQKKLSGVSDFRRQHRLIMDELAQNACDPDVRTKQHPGGSRSVLWYFLRIRSTDPVLPCIG